jgi:hypothetical protein
MPVGEFLAGLYGHSRNILLGTPFERVSPGHAA